MGEKRNARNILVEKPKRKRPLGRHGCILEDNIKSNLIEIGWGCVGWICVAQDRDKECCEHGYELRVQ
jgi:hypothetical protein